MRNWIEEIRLKVSETKNNYNGKDILIQVSEPLMDLLIELASTTDALQREEVAGTRDQPKFFGCHTVVSNEISTYRIFVECIDGTGKKWDEQMHDFAKGLRDYINGDQR